MSSYVEDQAPEPGYLERSELLWLRLAAIMLVLFLAGVAIITWFGFRTLPTLVQPANAQTGAKLSTPAALLTSSGFSNPSLAQRPDGGIDIYMVARMWQWDPQQITVRAGQPVRFLLTSADVIHGFRILDTPVNVMVFPGAVASSDFTFSRPGTYRVACTEYCGTGHQNMVTTITVEPRQ